MTTAAILDATAATLTLADRSDPLACLYVTVDGLADRRVAAFLARWHPGCDTTALDWQPVRRPRSALVGIEVAHTCGDPELVGTTLRLVFDVARDAAALEHLASTEALVVGTRAWGAFANAFGAYGIDGAAVREAVTAARRGLADLVGAGPATAPHRT